MFLMDQYKDILESKLPDFNKIKDGLFPNCILISENFSSWQMFRTAYSLEFSRWKYNLYITWKVIQTGINIQSLQVIALKHFEIIAPK